MHVMGNKHLKGQTHHQHPLPAHIPRQLRGTQLWGELAGGWVLPSFHAPRVWQGPGTVHREGNPNRGQLPLLQTE